MGMLNSRVLLNQVSSDTTPLYPRETNLKRRVGYAEFAHSNTDESVFKLAGKLEAEAPNENLNTFNGRLVMKDDSALDATGKTFSMTMNQFLPRGSVLRNTGFVYGVVIYAGRDSKIMKNLKSGKLKFSTLEHKLNRLILGVFVYNIFLIVSSMAFETVTWKELRVTALGWYVDQVWAGDGNVAKVRSLSSISRSNLNSFVPIAALGQLIHFVFCALHLRYPDFSLRHHGNCAILTRPMDDLGRAPYGETNRK